MTTKQKALKGLLILMVILAVSMFFARTVQTITTPKVQKIKATRGKLEDKISLTGEIYFPEGEDVVLPEAAGLGVSVSKVTAKEGYQVKQGDLLLTTVTGEYEKQMDTLVAEYKKAARALVDERAKTIRLDATTQHNDIYNAMVKASDTYYLKHYEAMALAQKLHYDINPDIASWGKLPEELLTAPKGKAAEVPPQPPQITADKEKYPGMQEALDTAFQAYVDSQLANRKLLDLYTGVGGLRRAANNTFDSIKKQDESREQMADAQRKMLALDAQRAAVLEVRAPHDGYLTKFALKVGDSYDGVKALYTISKEGDTPSLRCDITQVKKTLKKGMKVTVEGIKGDLTISDITVSGDNRKYAYVELTAKQISDLGGLSALMGKQTPVSITYRADKTTTLIPASALRTDSDGSSFVYTVQQQYGGLLSNSGFTVKKTPVTVIEKSDKLVSLQDDLSFSDVADNEDRTITDGQQVMEYVD